MATIPGIAGESKKYAPSSPTPISAIDQGTGRPLNNGQASISFNAGDSGRLPLSYTITSAPGSYSATGTSSPITITGLQSGTSYTYSITATNSIGVSSISSSTSPITATTIPGTPSGGGAVSGTTLSYTMQPPSNNGGSSITNLYTTNTTNNQTVNFPVTGGTANIPLSSFQNNSLTLYAANVNGASNVSTSAYCPGSGTAPAVFNGFGAGGLPGAVFIDSSNNLFSSNGASVNLITGGTGSSGYTTNVGLGSCKPFSDGTYFYTFDYVAYPGPIGRITKFLISTGAVQWYSSFNWNANSSPSWGGRQYIKVDSSGNVYLLGSSSGSNGLQVGFLIKLNSSGILQWNRQLTAPSGSSVSAISLGLDSSGNIYVVTSAQSNCVSKYNSSGTLQWQTSFLGTGPICACTDSSGNTVFISTGGGGAGYLATINSSGTYGSPYNLSSIGANTSDIYSKDMDVDSSGNLYVISSYNSSYAQVIKINSNKTAAFSYMLSTSSINLYFFSGQIFISTNGSQIVFQLQFGGNSNPILFRLSATSALSSSAATFQGFSVNLSSSSFSISSGSSLGTTTNTTTDSAGSATVNASLASPSSSSSTNVLIGSLF